MASSPAELADGSTATHEALAPASREQMATRTRMLRRGLRAAVRALWLLVVGLQVRLRFFLLVAVLGLVMHQWSNLGRYWDRLFGPLGADERRQAVSADTEYFCPMDPGVVSNWPGKCSICNMALVRRKRGDATLLPSGVVARMQFSPYRVQLAGIHTTPAVFRPLRREQLLLGRVVGEPAPATNEPLLLQPETAGLQAGAHDSSRISVVCTVWKTDRAWLRVGGTVQVVCEDLPSRPTVEGVWAGPVSEDGSLWRVRLADLPPGLAAGMLVGVRAFTAVADCPPFDTQPRPVPDLLPGEPRQLSACAEHPFVLRAEAGLCPLDSEPLIPQALRPCERVRWWCPIHRHQRADAPGQCCPDCQSLLAPRVERFVPLGCVLCVPQSAVIDTGAQQLVYVERHAGMFDGVLIEAEPPVDGWVPVLRGVNEGDRVATAAAFLVDAEARLNPALAAAYFGASGTRREESGAGATAAAMQAGVVLAGLAPQEAESAARQGICPVTGLELGSMGQPLPTDVYGVRVWVCCAGCISALQKHPHEYMARLP